MNWSGVSAVAELIGALGVIISLVYLATQIRVSRLESRASSIDRLVELWSKYVGANADHPHLAAIVAKASLDDRGFEQLPLNERIQLSAHLTRMFLVFQAFHDHKSDGTVDGELWDAVNRTIRDISSIPMFDLWWSTRRHWFANSFASYIETLTGSNEKSELKYLSSDGT